MEVQRLVSIAPVAVAHRALKDSILMGHTIPKVRCKKGLYSLFISLVEIIFVLYGTFFQVHGSYSLESQNDSES
jgi:hypothetical protein